MPLSNTEQHGNLFRYSFQASDAPTITNFFAREASLKFEGEVFEEAKNGEGMVEGVAMTLANQRMITGTFTGYIAAGFSSGDIATTFNFTPSATVGNRFFMVKDISEPRAKGKYWEVSLSVQSNFLITS